MTLNEIKAQDPDGMYEAIRTFPDQFSVGRTAAASPALPESEFASVVICGMGGSAIGGELLCSLVAPASSTPFFVNRSYDLPAFVDDRALVIISSYSGNTEETLSAFDEAEKRGATIIGLTSGGKVQERCENAGYPVVVMPGGMQPRAALGYSFAALVTIAERLAFIKSQEEAWEEAIALLHDLAEQEANPDRSSGYELAESLWDLTPLIYTGNGLLRPVGTRWCGQIQENAKRLAFGNRLPELNHNEIMGWEERSAIHRQIGIVMLHDSGDHAAVRRRTEVTKELLHDRAAKWIDVHSQGRSPLARMLSIIHLGDWFSFYLAMLHGVDPTPVKLISRLKETLATTV